MDSSATRPTASGVRADSRTEIAPIEGMLARQQFEHHAGQRKYVVAWILTAGGGDHLRDPAPHLPGPDNPNPLNPCVAHCISLQSFFLHRNRPRPGSLGGAYAVNFQFLLASRRRLT